MSYDNSLFSLSNNFGPFPFGASETLPWLEPHSIYIVSSLVGSSHTSSSSHKYGVSSNQNAPISSIVFDDTPNYSTHTFHSYEYILEAMITLDYP